MKIGIDQVRLAAAVCTLLVGANSAGAADDVSRWDGDGRSAARLIAGSPPPRIVPFVRAGVQIRLKAGWHTYWRYPGDSGVPPQFDFTGSQNVKQVHVLWPAPQRLSEDGGVSIGYAHDLTLPLHVVPQDLSKPVALKMKLDYAICEKMCVPAVAKAELTLASGPVSQDATLTAAFEAQVPKKACTRRRARPFRYPFGPARDRIEGTARRRRCRGAGRGSRRSVCRGSDAAMGAAGAGSARRGAGGPQAVRIRSRRRTAGRQYDSALVTLTAVGEQGAIEVAIRLD